MDKNKKINRRSKTFLDLCDQHILDLMTSGWSPARIEQELIDNYEFASGDNARKAIKRVNNKLAEVNKEEFDVKVSKYIEMYQNLYKNAVDSGEWKTANGILDSIVKIQGLLTQKIEAKVEGVFEVKFE